MVKRNELICLLLVFLLGLGVVLGRTLSSEEKLFAREFISNLFELRGLCEIAPRSPLCTGGKR